jgi:electron transport complex protein RnfC
MKKLSFIKGMLPVDGLDFAQVRASSQERVLEQFTPRDVVIPMQQHMGTPADPCVSIHDYVSIGQMIGRPTSLVSAPVHASISGTVTDVSSIILPSGIKSTAIFIHSDLKRTLAPTVQKRPSPETLTSKELQKLLLYSGVVGMGGEGYPASAKCQRTIRAGAHTMLVNGLQSEPYLNSDIHILRETTERVIKGAVALSGICKTNKIVFCLQDNCPQEMIVLQEAVTRIQKLLPDRELSVTIFKSRFPQGYEKLLIKAYYGVELQKQQTSEEAVGAVIFNVTTCASFWDMVDRNLPSTSRVISISGDSMIGHNVHVPIGTKVSEILERIPGISARCCYKRPRYTNH